MHRILTAIVAFGAVYVIVDLLDTLHAIRGELQALRTQRQLDALQQGEEQRQHIAGTRDIFIRR